MTTHEMAVKFIEDNDLNPSLVLDLDILLLKAQREQIKEIQEKLKK